MYIYTHTYDLQRRGGGDAHTRRHTHIYTDVGICLKYVLRVIICTHTIQSDEEKATCTHTHPHTHTYLYRYMIYHPRIDNSHSNRHELMGLRIFNIVAKLKILQNVTNITCTDKLDYQNCV